MARTPAGKKVRYSTEKDGPFCGAKRTNRSKTCKNYAGFRTEHPGVGRCFKHGGNTVKSGQVMQHGRYSKIEHKRVKEIMDDLALIHDNAMDLIPEVNLLRALLIDYINHYDEFVEALMAWYADPETKSRPRRVLDVADAATLVESISRVVHRMHQINSEGAVSLVTFKRVTEAMGIIMAKYVKDEKILEHISNEWANLALDAKTAPVDDLDPDDNED